MIKSFFWKRFFPPGSLYKAMANDMKEMAHWFWWVLCTECLQSSLNSCRETLTPNSVAFEDGALGGNWVQMRSWGWDPNHGISALIRRDTRVLTLHHFPPHHHVKTQKEGAAYKAGKEASSGIGLAGTLMLDFQSPELQAINLCCLSCLSYGILLWQLKLKKTLGLFSKIIFWNQ